jgi:hypothetical protein
MGKGKQPLSFAYRGVAGLRKTLHTDVCITLQQHADGRRWGASYYGRRLFSIFETCLRHRQDSPAIPEACTGATGDPVTEGVKGRILGKKEQMDEMFHENCFIVPTIGYEFRAKTLSLTHVLFLAPLKLQRCAMGLLSNSYEFRSLETCPDKHHCATQFYHSRWNIQQIMG